MDYLHRKYKKDYDYVGIIVDILPPTWEGKAEAVMGVGYFCIDFEYENHPLGPLWTICYRMSHEFLHMLLLHLGFPLKTWNNLVHENDTAPRYPDFWEKERRIWWLHHPYWFFMRYMVVSMKWILRDNRTSKTKFSTVSGNYLE